MANDILIPGKRDLDGLVETTVLCFNGRFIRVEFIRKGMVGSLHPETPYAQIRDLDNGEILCTVMHGFHLHHAFVWKDQLYLFATDFYGIWMSCTRDMVNWSAPELVFNSENSTEIYYQNNTIVWNGEYFVMGLDLLDGAYDFNVCFAKSYDLREWHYIPGAIYRADIYTSCPLLKYCDGWYYLFHVRARKDRSKEEFAAGSYEFMRDSEYHIEDWILETFVARSKDLLTWEDSRMNPILTPDVSQLLVPRNEGDKNIYRVNNYSDLQLYERDGKTKGFFSVSDQTDNAVPYLQAAEYDGPLKEFYKALFENN